jgi:hypothetical protein
MSISAKPRIRFGDANAARSIASGRPYFSEKPLHCSDRYVIFRLDCLAAPLTFDHAT